MNAFKFGQFIKRAVKPLASGVVSPNIGMDKAKLVEPPKQNVQLPAMQQTGPNSWGRKYTSQTRGGLTTHINGQEVPMNAEQNAYLGKIDEVRRRMDQSGLSPAGGGQAGMAQPQANDDPFQEVSSPAQPQRSPQQQLNDYRVQQAKADRAAAMQRQGLDANNPADLAKFKGGRTGPLPPSNFPTGTPDVQPQQPATPPQSPYGARPTSLTSPSKFKPLPKPAAPRPGIRAMPAATGMGPASAAAVATQPNVTTMKVDNAALQRQLKQQQAQAPAPQPQAQQQQPSMFQRAMKMLPGQNAWANQTGGNAGPGPLAAPMSNVSNAFNNATGQQDPPHIITTDNGRKFNTQTKKFLDGRPGGFAR